MEHDILTIVPPVRNGVIMTVILLKIGVQRPLLTMIPTMMSTSMMIKQELNCVYYRRHKKTEVNSTRSTTGQGTIHE
jgi:hypothetical protein